MLLTSDKRRSKSAGNSDLDCHLSPVWRQMAIINSISNYFLSMFVDRIDIFDCPLSGVRIMPRFTDRTDHDTCMGKT